MNAPLRQALDALRNSGATGIPSGSVVMAANDGQQWPGTKINGDHWSLTKNREESYNCEC